MWRVTRKTKLTMILRIKCDNTRRRSDDDEYNPLEDCDEQVDFTERNKFTVAENHKCKKKGSIYAVQSSLKPNQ